MKRRRGLLYALIATYVLAALVVGAFVLGAFQPDQTPPASDDVLAITFGFDRDPVTRTFTTEVEGAPVPTNELDEGALTVRLRSDLRNEDRAAEFPADQVTLGVTRQTGMRVSLAITANPWTPERVQAGIYSGVIEVRGTDVTGDVPVQIYLRSRDYKWAMLAFLLISFGASAGLLVKWITENLTAQAAMMRRLAFLKYAIGYGQDGTNLPVSVRMSIDDLADQIARQDYARVEEGFNAIDTQRTKLAEISSRFDGLYDQLAGQSALVDSHGTLALDASLLVNGVMDAEYRALLEVQAIPWPKEEAAIGEVTRRLGERFGATYTMLFDYLDTQNEGLRAALAALQEGSYDRARLLYESERKRMDDVSDSRTAAVPANVPSSTTVRQSPPDPRSEEDLYALAWIFRHARFIAAIASVLVVSLVGLKLEYLDNQSFDGDLTTWLTLGLWGLVVELSGLSVLDVVGRLGSSAAGATPAARA